MIFTIGRARGLKVIFQSCLKSANHEAMKFLFFSNKYGTYFKVLTIKFQSLFICTVCVFGHVKKLKKYD